MTDGQKKKRTSGRQVPLPRNPELLSTLFAPAATLLSRERRRVLSGRRPSRSRKSPNKTVFWKRSPACENISSFFSPHRAG
jgi:hypothetical protein